jgi:CRP-like cAMP-binding protein
VAQHLAAVDAKPGERIVEEGAHDDALYLIKRGQLRVSAKKGGKEIALALLAPHDFFGDVAALRGIRRTATVTAVTPAELLRLPREALVALLERRPEIKSAFEEIQLGRFVATSAALSKS